MLLIVLSFATEAERDKFEYLYERYKRLLLSKAYGVLRDHMLAEDATSEAFLRVYKNLDKIDDPDSPRTIAFLVTIVKNAALTLLAKKKKQPLDELDEDKPGKQAAEEDAMSKINTGEIYKKLDALSEDCRSAFLLKYAYGCSNKEIGKLLKISANNAGVLLHRARTRLKTLLAAEGYSYE